jgi:PAS domain S-box-containing protein
MKKEEDFSTLRKQAEKALQNQAIDLKEVSFEEAQHLVHELQIQQIELEIQNEELLKANKELFTIQEQLDMFKEEYANLYDFAPVGYCTFDKNGQILDANLTAAEQLGVGKKSFINTQFDSYIVPEDQDKFSAHLKQTFKTKTPQVVEIRLKRKNDSQFYAQLHSIIIQNKGKKPPLCRTAIGDITELYRAREALLRRDGELALFNRVSQVFNSTLELDQILVTLMEEVRRLLEVTACSIWLTDPETNELVCRQAIGPHRDTVVGWRLDPDQGIAGWVASTGQSLIVPDAWADDRHFDGVDRLTGHPLHSILSVPMRIKQKVIGVLQVLDTAIDRFNLTDQALQELLAAMASIAIENARLHEQSRQDANTKEILLHEVNHRVENSLTTIIRLFSTVRRHSGLKKHSISKSLMTDMISRMKGLKSVHSFLSDFEWNPVPLSELSNRIITSSLEILPSNKQVTIEISPSSVRVSPEQAHNLGLVLNELVANTVKHTMSDRNTGHITVHIARVGDTVHFEFRDDGPGCPDDVLRFDRHNVGLYLVQKIVRKDLNGKFAIYNDQGIVAELRFKAQG